MEIVLLGHMGRDEALADRLEGHTINVVGQWENPGLSDIAKSSGGKYYHINRIDNVEGIADIVESICPDMFLTNFDDALAAGIVDTIDQRVKEGRIAELLIPCPNKAAAQIEWDKFNLRNLVDEIDPKYNPSNFMAETVEQVMLAVEFFENQNCEIVVKPRNLTGGKGVKVQGKHFHTFEEARRYALEVLLSPTQTGLEIQEKLEGHEFTLQLLTDGKTLIKAPATYDYPYREDDDLGPGTGGMGSFSMRLGENLPFISEDDYSEALELMQKILALMREKGLDYKGILYPTFFKTPNGLKIVEINARGGDPELINILDLLEDDVDLAKVLTQIANGELYSDSVRYKRLASAVVYLVSPEYGYSDEGPVYEFSLQPKIISDAGCRLRFAAAKRSVGNNYQNVKPSRIIGLSALGNHPWDARDKIIEAIEHGIESPVALSYRDDIASKSYIDSLAA